LAHTTTGCGKQGFPSAQPYLSHTPGANPFCCMFLGTFLFLFIHFLTFQPVVPTSTSCVESADIIALSQLQPPNKNYEYQNSACCDSPHLL
ncbi:hypothetical protein BO85DRAFT_382867, partial [Aspergillus piperis CBS 112811]